MSHPPTFKRIGELTDEILTHIEQIHKVKDDDADTAKQPELGNAGDRVGDIRQPDADEA